MSLDARLSKLLPGLSARQRAVLAMKALHAGQETPDVVRSMPPEQRREYNRYAALAFVANCHFPALLEQISRQIEALRWDLDRIQLLERAASMLEEDHPEEVAAAPVRPFGKLPKHGTVTVAVFLRSLAEELREDGFRELAFRWQELRSLELVAAEVAESFDGEDALHPETRAQLNATREAVGQINAALYARPRRLPEPTPDFLERTRGLIDLAFGALGLVDV